MSYIGKENNPHSTPSEQAKELQLTILRMYRDDPNISAIARTLGLSSSYTYKMYARALKAIIAPEVEQHRKLENARLDVMHTEAMRVMKAFHPFVSSGSVVRDILEDEDGNPIIDPDTGLVKTIRLQDTSNILKAIDRLIKISERRSRLWGLDAPVKTAFTTPDGEEESFVQFYIPENNRDNGQK